MILVVEDDEDVRDLLAFTLRTRGYNVELTTNGNDALGVLAQQRPCLVILDLVMPVMTGWEVLAEMKTRQLADVPVCVMSALGGPSPPEAVAVLRKPFETQDLYSIAEKFCGHAKPGAPPPFARG